LNDLYKQTEEIRALKS